MAILDEKFGADLALVEGNERRTQDVGLSVEGSLPVFSKRAKPVYSIYLTRAAPSCLAGQVGSDLIGA